MATTLHRAASDHTAATHLLRLLTCRDLPPDDSVSILHTTWTTGPPSTLQVPVQAPTTKRDGGLLPETHLLSIREIASACQLSEKAVRRAIDDGELPAVKLRSRLRVSPQDFAVWIAARRQQPRRRPTLSPAPRLARRAPSGTFRALVQTDADQGPSL